MDRNTHTYTPLNVAHRSFKVIHFGGSGKPVYDFIYRAVNTNFRSIFNRFRDIAGFVRPEPIFPIPYSQFRLIFGGVPFGVDP